ncbi:MAG: hypothetical protein AAFO74_15090 [Pseudomonadota bacterium]
MKRLIAAFAWIALPLSAHANTDLAQQWGVEASRLSEQTFELIHAVDIGETAEITDRYALDIHRFGRISAELARWIDQSQGPDDLGCIFRGMATEARDQLNVLEETSEATATRESLRRLAGMFTDAELIAFAAQRSPNDISRVSNKVKISCSADAHVVLGTLR